MKYKFAGIKMRIVILLHPRIYRQGRQEAFSSYGMTYGHPYTLKSLAYDFGRNKGEQR